MQPRDRRLMMAVSEGLSPSVPQGPSRDGIGRFVPYIFASTLVFTVLLWTGLGRESDDVSVLLQGPDDFMRLVQVIDWLDGQSWSDRVQRRLNPPAGVAMHWSRLADLPLAAAIRLTEPWFGRAGAVYLAALLVPPLLGGLFAALFLWAAISLLPARRALVPVMMIGTLLYPLGQFHPGRVDHHGLQLVLTILAIGLLIRAAESGRARAAVGLGIAGGTSLAIGLETLPFLGAVTVSLSLVWTLHGGKAATSLAIFGLAVTGTALVLLTLTLPRSEWTAVVCDQMSLAHVALTASVLTAGLGALVLEHRRPAAARTARLAMVGGIGIAGLALVAVAFPQCTADPYATLPAEVRYWFDRVNETRSLLELFHHEVGLAISIIILPLAALVSLVLQWIESADRADPRRIVLLALVLSSVTLVAWQARGAPYAGLVASLAIMPVAAGVNERADGVALSSLKQIVVRVGLRFCVPALCIVAVILPQRLLQPASSRTANAQVSECDASARVARSVFAALNDPAGLGAETRTIAAPIDIGASILLLTRHRVLAAPYHRNIQGLIDNRRIFAGTEEQAMATVRAREVEAVLFCRKFVPVTTYADHPAFLNEHLSAGRPPWWLAPIAHSEDMDLYRVHPAARALP